MWLTDLELGLSAIETLIGALFEIPGRDPMRIEVVSSQRRLVSYRCRCLEGGTGLIEVSLGSGVDVLLFAWLD